MPSPPFPIVLSPPPLEGQGRQPDIMPSRPQDRHQSVGFNLQHEFETLNADLDLDLNQSEPPLLGSNYPLAPRPTLSFLQHPLPALGPLTLASFGHQLASMASSAQPQQPQSLNIVPGTSNVSSAATASGFLPRPHLVQDFAWSSVSPFHHDLMTFTLWIENLTPNDTATMVNHLCNLLSPETLQLFRLNLAVHSQLHMSSNSTGPSVLGSHPEPQQQLLLLQQRHQASGMDDLFDQLSLQPRYDHLQQPKPKHRFDKLEKLRPRSADPHTRLADRKLPTSHLYEKTLFLQAAALQHQPLQQLLAANGLNGPPNVGPNGGQSHGANQGVPDDMSTQLKLGALATISNRVALDLRKGFRYEQLVGRLTNLLSVPPRASPGLRLQVSSGANNGISGGATGPQWPSISSASLSNNSNTSPGANVTNGHVQGTTSGSGSGPGSGHGSTLSTSTSSFDLTPTSLMPPDIANLELLKNIPAWLKLLRLHKYTDCLKDIPWRELIELDDSVLEEKGVKALGARRKLLKAFDVVKQNTN